MSTLWQEIRYKMLQSGSKLNLLIGINILVYLAINIPATVESLINGFGNSSIAFYANDYLDATAYLPKLATRFWTPLTYMFMHAGIFHILFNMLWLYWIGQIFEEYLGNRRTITLYLMGGLAGFIFFAACYNLFPAFSRTNALFVPIVGASASVMAIVVATATLLPNYTIYLMLLGPVKLKWLALFYVAIDFLSIAGPNAGGEIAHLGGALFGFIYIKQLQKGRDWGNPITKMFKSRSKIKVVSKNTSYRSTNSLPKEEEIDRILDKISQTGYDSLSKQEKETLFRASNNSNEG